MGESFGVDTGVRGISFFYKISDGTESGNLTVNNGNSNAGAVIGGQMGRLSKTDTDWFVSCTGGVNLTRDTDPDVTGAHVLTPVNGDLATAALCWTPDSIGLSGASILTWDGVNDSVTQVNTVANTQGNDQRFLLFRRGMAGGGTGSPPVWVATAAGSVAAACVFTLFHDGPSASRVKPYVGNRAAIRRASTY